jgi:hypothetical protein
MINKTGNNMAGMLAQASPEAAAAIIAIDDANKSRNVARMTRKKAQLDRLTLMKKGANKLRDMAKNALHSSIYNGVLGSVQAGASIGSSFCKEGSNSAKALGGVASVSKAFQSVDPFNVATARDQAEKAEIEIQAEAVSHRESDAADEMNRASQSRSTVMGTLGKIVDASHGKDMEANRL